MPFHDFSSTVKWVNVNFNGNPPSSSGHKAVNRDYV